jgi:(1->4)-alpha-D-glucan 1-alpha-D-glucosylmutase
VAEIPRCTYRLQLRNGAGFAQAADLVPYLARLGVSHLYLSPPFTARSGSTHGYDVADANALDPVLGGEAAFADLARALREAGLGLILDIVPNHMGVGPDNPWWWDVLRLGRESAYAGFFDIDFERDPDGRLVRRCWAHPWRR